MADKKPQGTNRDPEAPELDPAGEASKALQGKKFTPPIRGTRRWISFAPP